ncbi:predicted protein [Lodderomyces elongisporus NRRL YB-4239]|uniref:Uncharacterized protein n=1 Tax=Lodderomyces elongisporus (strain ATCC 11503 / CBS 2605 / JCM 1781 / NBRC 1676 / NRRL YB-4239) TaxID=379508 RepID=A5E4S0_LODEL|nr:predicted protein [Lodderomyces elongisporus NRRL YB-4239]
MRDGSYSYIHFTHQNQVQFMESWQNEPLQYDDVDIPAQANGITSANGGVGDGSGSGADFLNNTEDGDAGLMGTDSHEISSNFKSRMTARQKKQWMDLALHESFKSDLKKFKDSTILPNMINNGGKSELGIDSRNDHQPNSIIEN